MWNECIRSIQLYSVKINIDDNMHSHLQCTHFNATLTVYNIQRNSKPSGGKRERRGLTCWRGYSPVAEAARLAPLCSGSSDLQLVPDARSKTTTSLMAKISGKAAPKLVNVTFLIPNSDYVTDNIERRQIVTASFKGLSGVL